MSVRALPAAAAVGGRVASALTFATPSLLTSIERGATFHKRNAARGPGSRIEPLPLAALLRAGAAGCKHSRGTEHPPGVATLIARRTLPYRRKRPLPRRRAVHRQTARPAADRLT